jgi:hypothetical protein
VPPAERTGLVTVYNLGHAVATVSGAATGAALLRWLGEDHTAYVCLFVLSACLRLAAVPLAWRIRIPHPEPVAPQGRDQPAAPQEGDQPVAPQGRGHSAAQPAVGNRSSCAMLSRKVRALP